MKKNKSWATICSSLSFEIKKGTDCVSGVRTERVGLEPKSKHCNAQLIQLERHELHLCLATQPCSGAAGRQHYLLATSKKNYPEYVFLWGVFPL